MTEGSVNQDPWDCEAYGPEGTGIGVICFFADPGRRTCSDPVDCHARMAVERRRVYSRIHDLAADGNEACVYLASVFTDPEQILGGAQADE